MPTPADPHDNAITAKKAAVFNIIFFMLKAYNVYVLMPNHFNLTSPPSIAIFK